MIELTGHKGLVVALAYSPDGRTLASASADGTARLWDVTTGQLKATLQSPSARANCVAFSPDGKTLAIGYSYPRGLIEVWSINPPAQELRWLAHAVMARGVAYHPNSKSIFTAGDGKSLQVWTLRKRSVNSIPSAMPDIHAVVAAVSVSPNGEYCAAVTWRRGAIHVFELTDYQIYRSTHELSEWGYSIAYHPDGTRLATGFDGTASIWAPTDYRPPLIWPAHAGAVLGVAFTPDGKTLLTGGADGLVKLWDMTGQLRREFDWQLGDVASVAFAPDGLTAAAGGYEKILVWDVSE